MPETEPEAVFAATEPERETSAEAETAPGQEPEATPAFAPEAESAPAQTPARAEDDAGSIRERWIKFEEDETEEEPKSGKAGKIVIGILILLLLSQLALIGIAYFAPESAVGQFVDEKAKQILTFFTGEDNHSIALKTDRNLPAEDKTGLIQLKLDANQNDAIHVIKYNGALRFIYGKDYALADLDNSSILENNQWYAKGNGAYAYYDEEAIGAVIAYESAKALTEGQVFETLEIGEIRQGGNILYVWVATEISPGARTEQVLRIEISEQSMNVVEEIDA